MFDRNSLTEFHELFCYNSLVFLKSCVIVFFIDVQVYR